MDPHSFNYMWPLYLSFYIAKMRVNIEGIPVWFMEEILVLYKYSTKRIIIKKKKKTKQNSVREGAFCLYHPWPSPFIKYAESLPQNAES